MAVPPKPMPETDRILVLADDPARGAALAGEIRLPGKEIVVATALDTDPRRWSAIVAVGEGRADPVASLTELVQRAAGECALVATGIPADRLEAALDLGLEEAIAAGASPAEVSQRIGNAIRRAGGRSQLSRSELEALLDITEAATSHLELEELLRVVVARIAAVVPVDRCSAILLDGEEDQAIVMASHDVPGLRRLRIDIRRYPELREAITSLAPVVIDDLHTHPLMEEVRPLVSGLPVSSLVVAPLVAQGDAYGALYLRLARDRAFGSHEQVFVRAAASAVANSVRNARLHTSVREKRDELEAAYHERYEELGRLNEQLREADRIKDELLAVCSHDVRAPLNVLLGHARLLLAGQATPQQQRSLDAIERQGLRVLQLVQQILERGRGRHGALELTLDRIDLAATARTVAEDLGTLGADRQVQVTASGDELVVDADPSGVRQVLENLVSNAVAHSPDGADVEVHVALDGTSGDRARVEVRDRGPGIPEAELPLVFERYRKSGESKGLGLGLAICREVVELHGGQIWAQQREGGGTSFVFTLPLRKGQVAAEGKPRVLVIEEQPGLRGALQAALGSRCSLSFSTSARDGVAQARALLPDMILVDAELPPGGAAIGAALRAEPGLGEVPLVLLGHSSGEAGTGIRSLRLPLRQPELDALLSVLLPA